MPAQQYSDQANPFRVRSDGDVPVGVQLGWRLRTLILTGHLKPGETLPSVRRMAGWAGVNANTVKSVYDSLREEGLIDGRQGKGTFVAEGAVARPGLESIVMETVRRGEEAGTGARDLAVAFMACADMLESQGGGPGAPDPEAEPSSETLEIRQELRRQIARLESELATYVRELPAGEMPTAPTWEMGHVASVEELERIRDTMIAKLFKAKEVAEDNARKEDEARAERSKPEKPGPLSRAMSWWGEAMSREG